MNTHVLSNTRTTTITKAVLIHVGLVAAAILLPAVAHLSGAPVRWLLPMHWPVIFAGLMLGWRSGLLIGLLAPATNWLLTGFPLPMMLPAMTVELAIYGFASGWLMQLGLKPILSVAIAALLGRVFFIGAAALTHVYADTFPAYLQAAMLPGLFAGVLQALFLPVLVKMISRSDSA